MNRTFLFGLFAAGIATLILFLGSTSGSASSTISTPTEKTGIIIILVMLVNIWALQDRKKRQGGYLSFNEGISTGLKVTIIYSLILWLTSYIFFKWYVPNFSLQENVQDFANTKAPSAEGFTSWLEEFSPFSLSVISSLFMALLGIIWTIIFSFFLRKSQKKP